MSIRTDRVRLVVLVKKQDSISAEEFSRYWLEEHSKIFLSVSIVQTNILKYEQGHANGKILKIMEGMGLPIAGWAGLSVIEADSYEKIFAVFKDEEYNKVVIPDQKKFVDREGSQVLPLNLATILEK